MTDCGDPPRLVPHELIPAARLIHRELDYGGGREPFHPDDVDGYDNLQDVVCLWPVN